jgi:hypothetical protein
VAMSAQAAPLAPRLPYRAIYLANQEWAPLPNDPASQPSVDTAPPIELVAEGCGWGWYRPHWSDRNEEDRQIGQDDPGKQTQGQTEGENTAASEHGRLPEP